LLLGLAVLAWHGAWNSLTVSAVKPVVSESEDVREIVALMEKMADIFTEYNDFSDRFAQVLLGCARTTFEVVIHLPRLGLPFG
jgi:hypothetical protein